MLGLQHLIRLPALGVALVSLSVSLTAYAAQQDIAALLDDVIDGPHRSEENRARDRYRHPKETLMFFGLKPDMTVVEISPAAGWYTEIIAPVLKQKGKFIGAAPALPADAPETFKRRDTAYKNMIASDPILYGSASAITYDPKDRKSTRLNSSHT